jgi:ATP-dependent Clp protease ATP-binding subunit ClpC
VPERFATKARRVIVLALEEARRFNHHYLGTEHLLLGLLREGEGVAAKALGSIGVSLEAVRAKVDEVIGNGVSAPSGELPRTRRFNKVLDLSVREARQIGHNYVDTEHIVLGIIREGEGVAAQIVLAMGVELAHLRDRVVQLISARETNESGR